MAPIIVAQKQASEKKAQPTGASTQLSLEKVKAKAKVNMDLALTKLKAAQGRALVLVKNPQFQTVTLSTASGAVILAPVGGAFGTASGIVLGTAAGAIPALFTFGLSLPVGAFVGGGAGLVVGTAAGAGMGAVGGGAVGFGGYKYRVEITSGVLTIKKKAVEAHERTKTAGSNALNMATKKVTIVVDGLKVRGLALSKSGKAKAGEFAKKTKETVATEKFKYSAAGASAGAIVGGGTGAVVGTTAGVAIGLIPALFTFGLSIPVGAVVGGCVGTATGTATGAAGGGLVGYGGCTYKKEIRSGAQTALAKVKENTAAAKSKIFDSASKVNKSIKFYSGTGGTAA